MDVSICIITYNQEKFIERAIDSALMQQCSFNYEIVISDDCSTDRTREIIVRYADKYPQLIKASYAETNLGMLRNWEKALKLCTGKYIALLEGDDFWTDPLKLQKQYNILEANPDCVISFTNAINKYEPGVQGYERYVEKTDEFYTTRDLLDYNFIPTCSVLMRNNISDKFFPPAYFKSPFADWIIHILNSKYGKIHFLNEFTCAYQIHDMGVWGGLKKEKQLLYRLEAVNCINDIITDPGLKKILAATRKRLLQNICLYYREEGQKWNHIKYRLKLILS